VIKSQIEESHWEESMDQLQRRVRILEIYVVLSLLAFGILALTAFTQTRTQKLDELTVERLNVVQRNGQLLAVMANADRLPDPIVDGVTFKAERPPGMIFYNDLGDECGGLVFGAIKTSDRYGAYSGLSLDQYRQSQAIGLVYNDHNGSRQVGLSVWDRPETSMIELMYRKRAITAMPEGPEKEAAKTRQREAELSPTRIFVGKDKDHNAKVTLNDAKGNARINLVVDPTGTPRIDFLDATGKVIYTLPNNSARSPK
jgi:hypothetical protein